MDKELKAKWVEALRSGRYPQGKRVLRTGDGTYCCLGVLREIQVPGVSYDNEMTACLFPEHRAGLDYDAMDHLANVMNDSLGKSFAEIADYIEKNL